MKKAIKEQLRLWAELCETEDFIVDDPSWFMHQVHGTSNQETMAFIASCLSYGSRKQFFPKIQFMLDASQGNIYHWVKERRFENDIANDDHCYYRLYRNRHVFTFLMRLSTMLDEYGSIGEYVGRQAMGDGYHAIRAISQYFAGYDIDSMVPRNVNSACKRVCMFLRWMVRDGSPVDLGLWADSIDKRTLIMPLDTHVIQCATRLGIIHTKTTSMQAAQRLTELMKEVFPDDPVRGDFALYGSEVMLIEGR